MSITRHRHAIAPIVLAALLAACGGHGPDRPVPAETDAALADAAATITSADMHRRVGVLADDSMRGRDTPSPGLDAAAGYVAGELERLGLEGAGDDGGFIQRYPFPLVAVDADRASLVVSGAGATRAQRYGRDFVVFLGGAAAVRAPLEFAGPASAFAGASLGERAMADRIPVVFLSGDVGRDWQRALSAAARAAAGAGAEAIVCILDPSLPDESFEQVTRFAASPRRVVGEPSGATRVLLRYAAARALFAAAGLDLDAMRDNVEAAGHPVPLPGLTADLGAPVRRIEDSSAPNVVALLRGSDPELASTYVVMSAHMDHVGVGRPDASGDSIYNGADDDASGTAGLLEVAEAFASLPARPRRSILFVGVSGEEKGLLGSRWFSDHPTVPLENVVADVNVDMIGRNAPDTIVVIGQRYSSLGPLVHDVAARHVELGLTVSDDIWPQERFFFRSDHFNFARKEIPALFFFAGTHEDYHRPSDELSRLDTDKAARVARLIFYTTAAIASAERRPEWTRDGLEEVRAMTRGGR